jgi:excisionase family DNA binding protein
VQRQPNDAMHHENAEPPNSAPNPLDSFGFYDKRGLAAYLGVSLRTVDTLVAKRLVPFIRLGSSKLVRFPKDELHRHLREHLMVRPRGHEGGGR